MIHKTQHPQCMNLLFTGPLNLETFTTVRFFKKLLYLVEIKLIFSFNRFAMRFIHTIMFVKLCLSISKLVQLFQY